MPQYLRISILSCIFCEFESRVGQKSFSSIQRISKSLCEVYISLMLLSFMDERVSACIGIEEEDGVLGQAEKPSLIKKRASGEAAAGTVRKEDIPSEMVVQSVC